MFKRVVMLLSIFFLIPTYLFAENSAQSSMVKIYTVCNESDYSNPWNMEGPESFSGSGVVIEGHQILTNAHVVSNQTYLQVRANGEPEKYDAYVIAISHEADLAVIGVRKQSFFNNIKPIKIGELPELQEQVVVCGFPIGGDTMSMTRGVVSRVENQLYAHSYLPLLAIQVDAAINYGNSGGPALSEDGFIVGVAMQSFEDAENIGHLIPTPIIKHFLLDLEDGNFDGIPSLGIEHQTTENGSLRKKLGIDDEMTGVLVSKIIPESSADGHLNVGDVILNIDGFDIANDATVSFRYRERTNYSFVVERKQIGESIELDVFRDGEINKISVLLQHKIGTDKLLISEYDKTPTYIIYGGLVFNPLTFNYLQCWGEEWLSDAPADLLSYIYRNWKTDQEKEIVVINKVLPVKENVGYHDICEEIVASINGQRVKSMQHLAQLLETQSSEYIDIETLQGAHIILERNSILAANESVKTLYKIDPDRSEDLM